MKKEYLYPVGKANLKCISLADLRGGTQGRGSKFFQFHAVFGKTWQNHMLATPCPIGLAHPFRGNPGSATDLYSVGKAYLKRTSLADLRGAQGTPPRGPKSFQFHAVFGEIWQNRMLATPCPIGLAPPPQGNPGSATAHYRHLISN